MRVVEVDEKRIDAIFSELDQCHLPGAAVGIALDGKPVYRKGFGLASAELPVVLSPTIRMRIGSTTKHFTVLAYLLLCEEGRAGLDDPIGRWLPELHAATRQVTMRQLMGNLSGLRDAHDINWQFSGRGRPVSSPDVLSLYRDIDDVNAAPGTTWIYCNGGFLLLSAAIERITGQSLEQVLRERIFEPVRMHDTLLRRWDTDFVPNSATLHMTTAHGGFDRSYFGTSLSGEGGVVSTVDDMLRWLAHMDAPVVGSAASWSAMKTPQDLANGTSTGYGLGLFIGRYRGVETLHHAGGVMGGNSQMLKVPAAGLDVAIMVNRADVIGMALVNEILDACLPGLEPVRKASPGPFATGVFRSRTTARVVQLFAKEGQQIVAIDGAEMPVEPDADGVLHPAGIFGHARQTVTLAGDPEKPSSIRLNRFGSTEELVPVHKPDRVDVGTIAGCYRSHSTGTEITICAADEGARLLSAGRFGTVLYSLECLADGIWRARPMNPTARDGVLSFARDGATLRFSNDRTWALIFHRVG